jgi:tetratricopeptide (TPR) repeat protein
LGKKVRRFSRQLLALVFTLGVSAPAFAQRERDTWTPASPSSFEVSGQVRMAETGLPAGRIPIRLERFGGGIVDQIDSDAGGRFRFPNLPRGYYRVIINVPGYRQTQQDADLQVVFRAFLIFDLVRTNAATAILTDVIDAKAPQSAREEFDNGRAALAKKSHEEAITHLEKAILIYPEFYQAHLLLGTAFVDTREWKKAEGSFQRALELKEDSPAALISLGEVYWRQRQFNEAEKALLDGLKLNDKSVHGYFTLGRLYWELGDINKAAPAIGRTLQLKPDFAEAHLVAGNILLKVNQPERALTEYQEYVKLAPKGEFVIETKELIAKLSKAVAENKR